MSTAVARPIHILLADDDEDDRLLTREAFQRAKLLNDLLVVRDGEELLEFLHRRAPFEHAPRPGIVLLDLNMPKIDGFEALREIRQAPALRDIPVVVLTTSRDEEDRARSLAGGADAFMSKPLELPRLLELIGKLHDYWIQLVETQAGEA